MLMVYPLCISRKRQKRRIAKHEKVWCIVSCVHTLRSLTARTKQAAGAERPGCGLGSCPAPACWGQCCWAPASPAPGARAPDAAHQEPALSMSALQPAEGAGNYNFESLHSFPTRRSSDLPSCEASLGKARPGQSSLAPADRKSTRLNSSHTDSSRMPSSA